MTRHLLNLHSPMLSFLTHCIIQSTDALQLLTGKWLITMNLAKSKAYKIPMCVSCVIFKMNCQSQHLHCKKLKYSPLGSLYYIFKYIF